MVSVRLPPPLDTTPITENILVATGLVIVQVGQAHTRRVLTLVVSGAGAAAAEASLGGLDPVAENHGVDEAEVWREDLRVYLIDDGDGYTSVGWKRA